MIKFELLITFSKLLAFLILLIGVMSLFVLNDKIVLEICIPTAAGLAGVKTFTAGFVQRRNDTSNISSNTNVEQSTKDNYKGVDNPDGIFGKPNNPDIG